MTTKFLAIGMENSVYGKCSGAEYDALRMFNLLKDKCDWCNFLKNEGANKNNVIENMKNVCDSDLGIIFYAGHGGSQKMKNYAPEESDGKDEMIFLYDKYMLDDEIWNIVSKAKGRIFLIFDCCHSETMFMAPPKKSFGEKLLSWICFWKNETPEENKPFEIVPRTSDVVDLMCWSGCADDETSMGNANGGIFTNTILKHFDFNLTYDELWEKISTDEYLSSKEIVKRTILKKDSDFEGKLVFR